MVLVPVLEPNLEPSSVQFSVLPSCQEPYFGLYHNLFQRVHISTLRFCHRSIPPRCSEILRFIGGEVQRYRGRAAREQRYRDLVSTCFWWRPCCSCHCPRRPTRSPTSPCSPCPPPPPAPCCPVLQQPSGPRPAAEPPHTDCWGMRIAMQLNWKWEIKGSADIKNLKFFKASALWADAFYKSKCPSVCLSICPSVCSLLRYRLNVFCPHLPKSDVQYF